MLAAGRHELGPGQGTLEVRTFREGVAARVGHDLVLEVTGWRAIVDVDTDQSWSVELSVDPRSLHVREGLHGVKPLTERDRAEIRANVDAKVLGGQPVEFRSRAVRAGGKSGIVLEGDLTLAGRTRPLSVLVETDEGGRLRGKVRLAQTAWGIRPYRGLLGALRVADEVEVSVDARLPVA